MGDMMRVFASFAAVAALITLTACDRMGIGGGTANQTANSSGNASGEAGKDPAGGNATAAAPGGKDPAGAVPASSSGAPVLDRAYIAGAWTDTPDCSDAAEFHQDGTFTAANGGGGLWNLDGDQLTMSGPGGTVVMRIAPIDQDTMNVVNPDGSLGRSTRC